MIRVTTDFGGIVRGLDDIIRYIDKIPFVRVEAEAANLADEAIEYAIEIINSSRKRPDKGTHKLENSLEWAELINDPGKQLVIGIFNVDKMNQEAPYWEIINDGGYIPPPSLGFFSGGNPPTQGASGEAWTHTGNPQDYLMIPRSPIQGIDYIGKALRQLPAKLDKVIVSFGNKIISDLGK